MNEIAIPSVTRLPIAVTRPISARGAATLATTEIAKGSQMRIESVISGH